MSEITVRPARPDEFAAAGELTVEAYDADGYLHDNDDYADVLRDAAGRAEHAELLVAIDDDGALLGTVTAVLPGTRYAELAREGELEFRMLGVARHARRRGVAETLVRAVLDRARELGAHRVVLCSMSTMATAHRLYERLGFTRAPERDWLPKPDIPLLAFTLDPNVR